MICRGFEFPKTHDLVLLWNRLGSGSGLELEMEDLQSLNRYSVEARYPGDWEPIDIKEVSRAVAKARRVRDAVRKVLPQDVLLGEA